MRHVLAGEDIERTLGECFGPGIQLVIALLGEQGGNGVGLLNVGGDGGGYGGLVVLVLERGDLGHGDADEAGY